MLLSFLLFFLKLIFISFMLFILLLSQAFDKNFNWLSLLIRNLPIALLPKLIIIFSISLIFQVLQRLSFFMLQSRTFSLQQLNVLIKLLFHLEQCLWFLNADLFFPQFAYNFFLPIVQNILHSFWGILQIVSSFLKQNEEVFKWRNP